MRQYLRGFSDAVVPIAATPEQKVQAILNWMNYGPPRPVAADAKDLPTRDPEVTLNYRQLLDACGTATNAFLNLSKSAGLRSRRLLLLTPARATKHVVAEVLIDGRWVVVDPAYRVLWRDAEGHLLTRDQLRIPQIFDQAIHAVPNYPEVYDYANVAHIRVVKFPMAGPQLRIVLDKVLPGWEENSNWSLLLERESFLTFTLAALASIFLLVFRLVLGRLTDRHLAEPRFSLRQYSQRVFAAVISTPEWK